MKNVKKEYLIIGGVILAAIVVMVILKKKKGNTAQTTPQTGGTTATELSKVSDADLKKLLDLQRSKGDKTFSGVNEFRIYFKPTTTTADIKDLIRLYSISDEDFTDQDSDNLSDLITKVKK